MASPELCVSCDGALRRPKLLSCLHSVCSPCVSNISRDCGSVVCTKCGQTTRSIWGVFALPNDCVSSSASSNAEQGGRSTNTVMSALRIAMPQPFARTVAWRCARFMHALILSPFVAGITRSEHSLSVLCRNEGQPLDVVFIRTRHSRCTVTFARRRSARDVERQELMAETATA